MNDYMRENKIEPVTPVLVAQAPKAPESKAADAKGGDGDAKSRPKDAKSGS